MLLRVKFGGALLLTLAGLLLAACSSADETADDVEMIESETTGLVDTTAPGAAEDPQETLRATVTTVESVDPGGGETSAGESDATGAESGESETNGTDSGDTNTTDTSENLTKKSGTGTKESTSGSSESKPTSSTSTSNSSTPPSTVPSAAGSQSTTVSNSYSGDFFVSKHGDNSDGRSWATAWNELDQIDWGEVGPGQTILLDGGKTEMTYRTKLEPAASGRSGERVVIALANEPGRDGRAVIFGGRSTPLPHCGQLSYDYQEDGVGGRGVEFFDISWVTLDGIKWGGIVIHGHNGNGVYLDDSVSHITIRNVEIYDNGIASQNSDGEWRPNKPGVALGGSSVRFERVMIHDNGQDAIQSISGSNKISDLEITRSWLYNSRRHPTKGESFNYCRHSDGLQIYGGGVVSGINIRDSYIGPGFTQGVILGQTPNQGGSEVVVNDVTITNTVFSKAAGLNIMAYRGVKAQNWTLDHVTSYCPTGYTGVCLLLEGSGHTVTNSVFYGSKFLLPDGLDTKSGNCQWEVKNYEIGREVDPQFISASPDPFESDDYSLRSGSPCAGAGSSIGSVWQLLRG